MRGFENMQNRKFLSSIGLVVSMAAMLALVGCDNSTASVENVTEAETKAIVKQEVTTQETTTIAPTEATTETPTEAHTEVATEAPAEAPTEAVTEQAEAVTEAQTEAPTEAAQEVVTEAATQAVSTNVYGKISDETADGYIIHDDWTVTTPIGTFSSVDAYNQATGHMEPSDPEHLTKGGYLAGDKKTAFLETHKGSTLAAKYTYDGMPFATYCATYGITDADLAAYNITWKGSK
jgi:hypothetical protein